MNLVLEFSKVSDFLSLIVLDTRNLLLLHFETLCVVCFPNVDKVSACIELSGCRLLLMILLCLVDF